MLAIRSGTLANTLWRREVQVKPTVPLEPSIDFGVLVSAVIVQDQMDLQPVGHFAIDGAHELDELGVAVPGKALADHRAGQHVQGREQRRGAIARAVVGHGAARPATIGNDACVRSRAWICDFSSMHNTIALCGGFKYSPTTSTSLSSNFASLDTLNVSTRWGCKPRSDQIRCTVAGLTPTRVAIVRHDQCVAPAGVVVANLTMSATVSSLIDGLPPRPSPILPNPANPSTTNRLRNARTVTGVTPTSSAITALATPSAAINNARACNTCRCGADRARANRCETRH